MDVPPPREEGPQSSVIAAVDWSREDRWIMFQQLLMPKKQEEAGFWERSQLDSKDNLSQRTSKGCLAP
eukprot:12898759-Prorocentrum_lima.AAC.1